MLTLRVIREVGDLDALKPEWRELMASSPSATPFQSPEWVCAWCTSFLGSKRPHVIALRDGERLVGLMPMTLSRLPWRALRPMGAGVSDYLHPLASSGYEGLVAGALWEYFRSVPGVDLVDLQQIREMEALAYRWQLESGSLGRLQKDQARHPDGGGIESGTNCAGSHPFPQMLAAIRFLLRRNDDPEIYVTHPLVVGIPESQSPSESDAPRTTADERGRDGRATGATVVRDEDCYVLDLPETWDQYVTSLSKSLRYEARRLEKPPYSSGEATVRTIRDAGEVRRGLDALFELHARRWRKRGLPGVFAMRRVREFHYRFAQEAVNTGLLRLGVIEQGGQILGVIYAMAVNQTVFFYQSGFDPDAKSLSPGSVLVAHTIREAIEGGAQHFDFLRGPEPYKLRWKPQHCTTNLRIMLRRTAVLGGAGEAMNRLRSALEARIRQRLASKSQPGA